MMLNLRLIQTFGLINLKNLFYVEKEIKNIMIKLYLKILKKIILLILNEFYNTII